jgi:catalase
VQALAKEAAARDFVADAFAHMKFIGYVEAAMPLFVKAGIEERDDGFVALTEPESCREFVATCHQLRFWARQEAAQRV